MRDKRVSSSQCVSHRMSIHLARTSWINNFSGTGDLMFDPLFSVAGFIVGMLVGMTGVGGGSLMTPLLILFFGVHPATAVGSDLLYAAATKTAGSFVHGFARSIDWRIVGRLASGSVPATALTVFVLSHFDLRSSEARSLITLTLCVALFATAFVLTFGEWALRLARRRTSELPRRETRNWTIFLGGALGILVTVSSIGAGAIGVVVLLFLYPTLPTSKIVGSDIAHAVPLTLTAGLGHWAIGSVDWTIVGSLLAGSLPGIVVGSMFAVRIPERALKLILASILFIVASRLVYDHAGAAANIVTALADRAIP
jgi:uncharacterized membrane protein YfcA